MTEIFGKIPALQREQARMSLPGIRPVGQADWVTVDDCYTAQITHKQALLADIPERVYQMRPAAEPAAAELLDVVLQLLATRDDFTIGAGEVICPDRRRVILDDRAPLLVLSQILQEDLCLHLKQDGAHHLMGALLCFPASWTLAEKIGKPLIGVHAPVAEYDAELARRVQRLFDGVQVGMPIWRANLLRYADPKLYQPRSEANPRPVGQPDSPYERSERQTLFRLPKTGAVVFAIHTVMARVDRPQESEAKVL